MLDTLQTDTLQIELLAHEIVVRLKDTEPGHCARVDFLDRSEALSVCHYLMQQQLAHGVHSIFSPHMKRKQKRTLFSLQQTRRLRYEIVSRNVSAYLFPSDLIDAAYSSIANSFALIDGRELNTLVLKRVLAQLSPELASDVRAVFARLRGLSGVSEEQRLDFALSVFRHMQSGATTQIGLELWRLGLIVDDSDTFVSRLDNNRDCALSLSHPSKLGATMRERIQSIKVDAATATALGQFFHGRAMNDVRTWSRELAKEQILTFDRWVFPKTIPAICALSA